MRILKTAPSLTWFLFMQMSVLALEPLAFIPQRSDASSMSYGGKDVIHNSQALEWNADAPYALSDTTVRPERRVETEYDRLSPANRKARNSVTMGIIGLCSLATLLIFPPLALAAVPLGILAIVKGQDAKKEGATRPQGTTLGIITLSLFTVALFLVAAIIVVATAWW